MKEHRLTYEGETLSLVEWAERMGVKPGVLRKRLFDGWPVERVLTEPRKRFPETLKRRGAPVIDLDVPFSQDPLAQALVKERGGFSLEELGELVGWSREKVRQIEEGALLKLRRAHG